MKTKTLIFCLLCLRCVVCFCSPLRQLQAADSSTNQTLQSLRLRAVRYPSDAETKKRLATVCLQQHLEADALEAARSAAALSPGDMEAKRLTILALARNGKYQSALDIWQGFPAKVRSAGADISSVIEAVKFAVRGDQRLRAAFPSQDRKGFQEAAQFFGKGIELDPDNLAMRKTLGWILLEKTFQPQAAYPHLAVVIKYHPADSETEEMFALACAQMGYLEEAVQRLRHLLVARPNDWWMKVNLAKSLARLGQKEEARRIYLEVLQREPGNAQARLGMAELAAWNGQSGEATRALQELLKEDSNNLDARALLGDVYRWDWRLAESRQEYQRVLTQLTTHYSAAIGLGELERSADPSVDVQAYQFLDSTDFQRSFLATHVRLPLTDRAYLLGRATEWQFTNPGFTHLDRTDGEVGLEYHWARWLETDARIDIFDYANRAAFLGGQLYSKLSPVPGCDIYSVVSLNQPFISSIATVHAGMREDSIGSGLDLALGRQLSFQYSLLLDHLSDGNDWMEIKPQISYRPFRKLDVFARVQYDYMTFAESKTNYWTPQNRQVISPILDLSLPVTQAILVKVSAQAPYVFDRSEFGHQIEAGPVVDLGRLQFACSYIFSWIPGDQGTWSGRVWQARLSFRF